MVGFVAEYLLYAMAVAYAAIWLFAEGRPGKVRLLVSAVIGLVLVLVLIKLAAAVHDDPRPFVQNPALHPLFPHAADNGFPSDHSAAAALIAMLVWLRHRWYGSLLAVCAVLIGAARVAAHVHHVQDIVAGLLIGALAAWLAGVVATWLIGRFAGRANITSNSSTRSAHGAR